MNTIGKILVICNFLFAIAVGGFLVFDFATRTNWKEAHDKLRRELEVASANNKVSVTMTDSVINQMRKHQNDLDSERTKRVESEAIFNSQLADERNKVEDANRRAKEADFNLKKAIEDKDTLQKEVVLAINNLKQSEKRVIELESDVQKFRTEAIQNKNNADTMQGRNETLLSQIRDLNKKLTEAENPTKVTSVSRSPLGNNPPPVRVQGSVLKVHAQDKSLVTISLGSDDGVQRDHTLDVFRKAPKAEWVGVIRILESRHKEAIGKLINTGLEPRKLLEGDLVADRITP